MLYQDYIRVPQIFDMGKEEHYFGEYIDEDGKGVANGVGLYSTLPYNVDMYENINNSVFNGMSMSSDSYKTRVGLMKNSIIYGPQIFCGQHEPVVYEYYKENKKIEGFTILINKDGSYSVGEYDKDGHFCGKAITFRYGRLYFERKNNFTNMGMPVHYVKVGWEYEIICSSLYMRLFDPSRGIKPAFFEGKRTSKDIYHTYHGGIQTLNSDPKYDFQTKDFLDDGEGYGIAPYSNGSLYFGEYSKNVRCGVGCYRSSNDNFYMGGFDNNKFSGTGVLCHKDLIEFGRFYDGVKDNIIFEIHDNYLYIKRYDKGKRVGNFYKIEKGSFNFEEYNDNAKLIQKLYFDNYKSKIDDDLKAEDKINPGVFESLKGYDYEVLKNGDIYIKKCNIDDKMQLYIPNCISGIRSGAFDGLKKIGMIYIHDNVKVLEKDCFSGCNSIFHIFYGEKGSIDTFNENTCNSSKLKELPIYKNIKLIKKGAFFNCKNLKNVIVYNPKCVIEKGAFPLNCKIKYVDEKTLKEEKVEKEGKEKVEKIKEKKLKKEHKKIEFKKIDFSVILAPILVLLKTICNFFKMIGNFFKNMFSKAKESNKKIDWFMVIPIIVMVVYLVLLFTKVIYEIGWDVKGEFTIFGYSMELTGLAVDWFESTKHGFFSAITIGLLQLILILISVILDIVVHIIMFVLCLVFIILQVIVQLLLGYGIPVLVPIYYIIMLIKTDKKLTYGIFSLVGLVFVITYYVLLIRGL